jgi:fatty acid desaturase
MWSHLAAVFFLCQHNPCFGIWVVIIPTVLTLFAISLHNWGQHIFVHPDSTMSTHPLHCSYNIINSTTNALIFNDGYHSIYHNDPLVHWSNYPSYFRDNFDAYKREGCFYFKNINNATIAFLCFRGRFDVLSSHLTRLDKNRSEDDATFLRKLLKPIGLGFPKER